ncbi:hypothetical protein PULV_a2514 [Pseudoalteromonas ulvae UL12]|nr:hypothetical protein [Pseudoalteromonas ulvae UL12]
MSEAVIDSPQKQVSAYLHSFTLSQYVKCVNIVQLTVAEHKLQM